VSDRRFTRPWLGAYAVPTKPFNHNLNPTRSSSFMPIIPPPTLLPSNFFPSLLFSIYRMGYIPDTRLYISYAKSRCCTNESPAPFFCIFILSQFSVRRCVNPLTFPPSETAPLLKARIPAMTTIPLLANPQATLDQPFRPPVSSVFQFFFSSPPYPYPPSVSAASGPLQPEIISAHPRLCPRPKVHLSPSPGEVSFFLRLLYLDILHIV